MHKTKEEGKRIKQPRSAEYARRHKLRRGRYARKPGEIPKEGWRDIALRVKDQIGLDNVSLVAAGVAFYAFLAIFPAIIATIMIYGLMVDPQTVQSHLQAMTGILPDQVSQLLNQQLSSIAGQSSGALGWGVAISILVALWSANKGMKGLFQGINIAYDEQDSRGFIKQNAITLLFTLGAIVLVIVSAALVVAMPVLLGNLGLPPVLQTVARWARWPVLGLMVIVGLALVYRYAPDRENARWNWVSWGAAVATVLWLIGSWAFSFYVNNFGSYNQTYGSLAAVVILMLWLMLSSFSILLGAEINSEMEGQTKADTTTGAERPMGERGAYHADTTGEQP